MSDLRISSVELAALKKTNEEHVLTFARDTVSGSVSAKELVEYMERNNFTKLEAVIHNFEDDNVKLACFKLSDDSYVEISKIPEVNKSNANFSDSFGMPKPMGI